MSKLDRVLEEQQRRCSANYQLLMRLLNNDPQLGKIYTFSGNTPTKGPAQGPAPTSTQQPLATDTKDIKSSDSLGSVRAGLCADPDLLGDNLNPVGAGLCAGPDHIFSVSAPSLEIKITKKSAYTDCLRLDFIGIPQVSWLTSLVMQLRLYHDAKLAEVISTTNLNEPVAKTIGSKAHLAKQQLNRWLFEVLAYF